MQPGLKLGDSGRDVERLHAVLVASGYLIDAGERERAEFGLSTVAALKALRHERGLPDRDEDDIDESIHAVLIAIEENITINVGSDAPTSGPTPDDRRGSVTGRLVDTTGAPMPGTKVDLLSMTVVGSHVLHHATTHEDGRFTIHYTRRKPLNLAVRAEDAKGDVLATSSTVFAAAVQIEIDLTTAKDGVVRAPSQFTVLSAAVNAALDGAVFADLNESRTVHQLSFLANAIATPFDQVAFLYIADALGHAHDVNPQTLFGLFDTGTPPSLTAALGTLPADGIDTAFTGQILTAVLSHADAMLAQSLTNAVAAGVLPSSYADIQAEELAKLRALRAVSTGAAPYVRGKTPLNDLLSAGGVAQSAQSAFVNTFAANNGGLGSTWKALRADKSLTLADLRALNTTLNTGELLTGNLPLVKDTLARLAAGTLGSLADLAMLDQADWEARISSVDPNATTIPQVLPNDTAADRIARFAKSLQGRFAARYPTPAFAGALSKSTNSPFRQAKALTSFLTNNATFDLHGASIDQYLVENKVSLEATALAELKTAQRLHRVAPFAPHVEALFSAGYASAQAIYFKGRAPFLAHMIGALGATQCAETFARAHMTYGASLALMGRYNGTFNKGVPANFAPPTPDPALLSNLPDLQALFGSLDSFQCDDCQSIYSPAAYLVDLLQYLAKFQAQILVIGASNTNPTVITCALNHGLATGASVTVSGIGGNHAANTTAAITVISDNSFSLDGVAGSGNYTGGGQITAQGMSVATARDALFLRRPEIQYVGLSCDNTNTVIPYIDLANEILERAVAGVAPPNTAIETEGTTAERRALPQQTQATVATSAYANTKAALFPLNLPFDQHFARTTAYLAGLGGGRANLLGLFKSVLPASAIAGAALDLSGAMQGIVTQADPAMPWTRWGLTQNPAVVINPNTRQPYSPNPADWVAAMNNVPFLMSQTGLTLNQLFQLLEVTWVTRQGVTLQLGTVLQAGVNVLSPDTDLMVLTGLDADVLDRANRFLRLWTASNLQMWEVDWALESAGGALGDGFLDFLTGAGAIATQLKLPLQDALTFWSPLETRDVVSHLGDEDAVVPSTYTSVFLNPAVVANSGNVFLTLAQAVVTGASNANPIVITTAGPHGFSTGMQVTIAGVTGNAAANGVFTITTTGPTSTSFSLDGVAGSGVWTGGGQATGPLSAPPLPSILSAGPTPTPQQVAINAALGLDAADVAVILDDSGAQPVLCLDTLGVLLRYQRLAAALSLTIADLISWVQLTGQRPFTANPADTQEFLRRLALLRGTTLGLPDLNYLLCGQSASQSALAFTTDQATAVLQTIAASTGKAVASEALTLIVVTPGTPIAITTSQPHGLATGGTVFVTGVTGIAAANGVQTVTVTAPNAFTLDGTSSVTAWTGGGAVVTDTVSLMGAIQTSVVSALADAADVSAAVITPIVAAKPALNLDFAAIENLLAQASVDPTQFPALIDATTQAVLAANLFTELGCTANAFAFVVRNSKSFGLIDVANLPVSPVQTTPYGEFEALLQALKLQTRQSARTPKLFDVLTAWLQVGAMPIDLATAIGGPAISVTGAAGSPIVITTDQPHGLVESAQVLIRGIQGDAAANGTFTISIQGQPANAFILQGTSSNGAYAAGGTVVSLAAPAMAFALNAQIADVTAIAGALNTQPPSVAPATRPGSLADMGMLTKIAAALDAARHGAISGATLVQLVSATPDFTTSAAAMSAFQARYPQSAWLAAVETVEDPLRQARRDALVAWLLGPGATTPAGAWFLTTNDLFNYYLIDPEMCACGETTRLLQPSLAIQQFVQQCFLNLSFGAAVDTINTAWSEWSWRQQYRLWQANREVFINPENYVLPELRTNASSFFTDMENDLAQSNCNQDATETALESYLRKLVGVSRLVVVAHFNQVNRASDGATVLHVFARTNGTPPQWWYRTRTTAVPAAGGTTVGVWSAWLSLNLDIATDHLMPVIWDERLYLFWPSFKLISEKARNSGVPQSGGGTSSAAQKFTAIQIHMSEFSAGQWQAKRSYEQHMFFDTEDGETAFTFKAIPDASLNLNISVFFGDQNSVSDLTFYAAVGTLRYPDARLVVKQTSYWTGLIPDADLVDTGLEPTYNTIQVVGALYVGGGSIVLPSPANYSWGGQNFVAGHWWDNPNPNPVPLYVMTSVTPSGVAGSVELLGQITDPRIVAPHQQLVFDSSDPFFVGDDARTYLVDPYYYTISSSAQVDNRSSSVRERSTGYHFATFYHPYSRTMLRELETTGISGLMSRKLQLNPQAVRGWSPNFDFNALYKPQTCVAKPFPGVAQAAPGQVGGPDAGESWLDFDPACGGAYSLYNWEIFYHAPMYIAAQLLQNQQYKSALSWLNYIFNPADNSGGPTPQRFWQLAPFNQMHQVDWTDQQITNLLQTLAVDKKQGIPNPAMINAITAWINDPYDPHMVAGTRIAAYGVATVMKLLDVLLAQGDAYYATYTAESVTLAEQCYMVGSMLLGTQPNQSRIPASQQTAAPTYASLTNIDDFANVLVNVENLVIAPEPPQALVQGVGQPPPSLPSLPANGDTLLFCIPPNPQLMAYWGQFAQRLYNIRHCLNLQGAAQPLPLYAPPINPLALIAAAQSGASGAGGVAAAPLYRFATYLQKAVELTNDVRAFGAQILAALEKQDAETLAALRATQELAIQTSILDVKTLQATEANDQIAVLNKQLATTQIRASFYSSQAFMNASEIAAIALQGGALIANGVAMVLDLAAGVAYVTPKVTAGAAGFGGSPALTVSFGGENIGNAATKAASVSRTIAGLLSEGASMAATIGGYQRRNDEWGLQANLANSELTTINSQITAANDRLNIANADIAVQTTQIANAQAISDFMTNKYTNAQLYSWMVTQLTTVYTQAYQLAQSLALQAQVAYGYELGRPLDQFIQPTYWNSQYKGLTAGDGLLFDLRRMEAQFIANNQRELELTKSISLALTEPLALQQLLQTGSCNITLDETLFDHDYPGKYFRRVRSVALTIPCVTGAYTGVHATLSLDSAVVRTVAPSSPYTSFQWANQAPVGSYPPGLYASPPLAATPIVALSHGQNDSGLFETNLHDERWLPFEGQGVISTWTLTLDARDNDFDLSTVTDVIMHVRYSARAGGDAEMVRQALPAPATRSILISARNTFSNAYYAFFNPTDPTATEQTLTLPLTDMVFPFANLGSPKITGVELVFALAPSLAVQMSTISIAGLFQPVTANTATPVTLSPAPGTMEDGVTAITALITPLALPGAPAGFTFTVPLSGVTGPVTILVAGQARLDSTLFEDIFLIVNYSLA